MDWQSIDTAPKDGSEIEVRDAHNRNGVAHWDVLNGGWKCGGVHHGFRHLPELDGHPWREWKSPEIWRIVKTAR